MQAAIAALGGAAGDRERQLQAVLDVHSALRTTKPGAVPPNTVAVLAAVLSAALHDAGLMLQSLQCLAAVCDVLRNSAPIMRLEGGLRATLAALQAPCGQQDCDIAACGVQLLATLSGTSPVTAQGLVQEKDVAGLLLTLLQQHVLDKAVAGAACDVLALASRYSKGARKLAAEALLVPAMKAVLHAHLTDARVAEAALKTLKNVAKHEPCRAALEEAGAVKVLLSAAASYANLPDQGKQVKRACRAVWLLCPQALAPLPGPSAGVALPHRDSKHLTIASAKDGDALRLRQLFPELQGGSGTSASTASTPSTGAAVASSTTAAEDTAADCASSANAATPPLPTRMLRPPIPMSTRPPTAAELTALARGPCAAAPEPFHAWGSALATRMMLHDLQRIAAPAGVVNRLVYDSGAGAKGGRRSGPAAVHACVERLPAACDSSCADGTCVSSGNNLVPSGACSTPSTGQLGVVSKAASAKVACPAPSSRRSSKHSAEPAVGGDATPTAALLLVDTGMQRLQLQATSSSSGSTSMVQAGQVAAVLPLPPGQLQFESRFEGGNLRAAVLVRDNEYDLFLAPDTNDRSKGSNMVQWFFFAVSNATPGASYKLNLVNCCKKESLYNLGKQPLMCAGVSTSSTKSNPPLHAETGASGSCDGSCSNSSSTSRGSRGRSSSSARSLSGWSRVGRDVCWYPSPYRGRAWIAPSTTGSGSNAGTDSLSSGTGTASSTSSPSAGTTLGSPSSAVSGGSPPSGATGTSSSRQGSMNFTAKRRKAGKPTAVAAGSTSSSKKAKDVAAVVEDLAQVGPGLYCCTFTVTFPSSGVFFIANCYPYSYKDLQDYLASAQLSAAHFAPAAPPLLQRSLLSHTLAGQHVELLTITDFSAPPEVLAAREYVVLSARVHPGETCASWIMQGMLDFLLQPHHPIAQRLRACFVFKIIPMLNPDGVAAGSYRCSLAGVDLNRTWDKGALPHLHPPIYHTKKLIEVLAECGRLALCLDLHGHSRLQDVFFFGCEPLAPKVAATAATATAATAAATAGTPAMAATAAATAARAPSQLQSQPAAQSPPQLPVPGSKEAVAASQEAAASIATTETASGEEASVFAAVESPSDGAAAGDSDSTSTPLSAHAAARLRVRMLPYLASKLHSGFSFAKCSFKTQKGKAGTARVVCARQLGVAGSYTLEASLGGCSATGTHFGITSYLSLGAALCEAVLELVEADDAALLADMAGNVVLPALADKTAGVAVKAGKTAVLGRRQSVCTE